MPNDNTTALVSQLGGLVTALLNSGLVAALAKLWRQWRRTASGLAEEGLYEVLEYETTLELLDRRGQNAMLRKRERVKYLQGGTIAFQDQAWGDGEILLDYRCSPGVPVDRYRPGHTTYILISLREVKSRGDVDEFNIEWGIRRGFLRNSELLETEISHRTRWIKAQVIFPPTRPPSRFAVVEDNTQRTQLLPENSLVQLPDGRWVVTWVKDRPRRFERFSLKWDW